MQDYAKEFSEVLKNAFKEHLDSKKHPPANTQAFLNGIKFPEYSSAVDRFVDNVSKNIPSTLDVLNKQKNSDRIALAGEAHEASVSFLKIAKNARETFIASKLDARKNEALALGVPQSVIDDIEKNRTTFQDTSMNPNPSYFQDFQMAMYSLTRAIEEYQNKTADMSSSMPAVEPDAPVPIAQDTTQNNVNDAMPAVAPGAPVPIAQDTTQNNAAPDSAAPNSAPANNPPGLSTSVVGKVNDAITKLNAPEVTNMLSDVQKSEVNNLVSMLNSLAAGTPPTDPNSLKEAIVKVRDELGNLTGADEISSAMMALSKLNTELNKTSPSQNQAQNPVQVQAQDNQVAIIPTAPPLEPDQVPSAPATPKLEGKSEVKTLAEFKDIIENATTAVGKKAVLEQKDNTYKILDASGKKSVTVTGDPSNFKITGDDVKQIAIVARSMAAEINTPLHFIMGADHNQNLKLLKELTIPAKENLTVKITISDNQANEMRAAFSKPEDKTKLAQLETILTKQSQLVRADPAPEAPRAGPR